MGKSKLQKDPEGAKKSLRTAIEFYHQTLTITSELKDIAGLEWLAWGHYGQTTHDNSSGEGRAVGNLGNAYSALGEFKEAVKYHTRRLEIANDTADMVSC